MATQVTGATGSCRGLDIAQGDGRPKSALHPDRHGEAANNNSPVMGAWVMRKAGKPWMRTFWELLPQE